MGQTFTSDDMLFHMLVVGGTGSGKTNAILHMLDLLHNKKYEEGRQRPALVLFDPGGDASVDLLRAIPKPEWKDRVVILDPEYVTFGFNLLSLPEGLTPEEKPQVVQALVDEFSVLLSDAFNTDATNAPRLMWIFKGALYFLYTFPRDPTLWELYNLVLLFTAKNPKEIEFLLRQRNIPDEIIRGTVEAISKLPQDAYMPVLNRISNFVLPPSSITFRTFCSRQTTIDIDAILEPGRLTIFRIPPDLPAEFRRIFASALVMKLYFACLKRAKRLERAGLPPAARTPVVFAADEFRDIAQLRILRTILSQSRKYGLYLWMVAQTLSDIPEDLLASVEANVGPMVAFRSSSDDARRLAKALSPLKPESVASLIPGLEDYSAIVRKRPVGGSPPDPPFRVTFPKLKEPSCGYDEAIAYMKEEMEKRFGGATGDRELMFRKDLEQAMKDSGECYLGGPAIWFPLPFLHQNKGEHGFSHLAMTFEDTCGWERGVLRASLMELASKGKVDTNIGTGRLFVGIDSETKQPQYREPTTAEEKAEAREVFYSISDSAEEEFFRLIPPPGADNRAGSPYHLAVMQSQLDKFWARGCFCAFDRGDRSDPFPDILVTEPLVSYVRGEKGKRRATIDPEKWKEKKIPVQIELNPAKEPERVREHYEYDVRNWGYEMVVVTSPPREVDVRRILQDKARSTFEVVIDSAGAPEDEVEKKLAEEKNREAEARMAARDTDAKREPSAAEAPREKVLEPFDRAQPEKIELWVLAKVSLTGYPGRPSLGSSIGIDVRQVSRYLKSLGKKGLLEKRGNVYLATEQGKDLVSRAGLTSDNLPAKPDALRVDMSSLEAPQA